MLVMKSSCEIAGAPSYCVFVSHYPQQGYFERHPPSTRSMEPVMKLAAAEAIAG